MAFILGGWDWEGACIQYREEVIRVLLKLMDDPDDDVRDWATFRAYNGGLDTPETRARLWKALEDTNCDVRGEAAQGLAQFGDSSFIPVLERMLWEDEDLSPCYFLAAEEFGDPALLPAVIAASERWLAEGHEMTWFIEPTIKALRERDFSVSDYLL
ncbi:MAG: HEAT repeat domain-containing protein [Armatimonadetes bacterium]|nr:HEAT repeat domain-containing protein [Armatimonadota bacterium]